MRQTKKNVLCKVVLTDKEKLECSAQLAQNISSKRRVEEENESFRTQIKSKIATCDAQINLNSEKINNGYEYRTIDCEVIYDFGEKTKTVIRPDTGEVVETDIITESELQEEMALKE